LEVDEEGDRESGGFEVVEALGGVFVGQAVDALEFEENTVFDDEVGVVVANLESFVVDGEGDLGLGGEAADGEFVEEGAVVDNFKEAGAEGVGNFEDGSEYLFGEGGFFEDGHDG
jgi:hypothetical protein